MPAVEPFSVRDADDAMRLQAEALAIGLIEPSVWNHYWGRTIDHLKQRIDQQFNAVGEPIESGGLGASDGGDPGVDGTAPTAGN